MDDDNVTPNDEDISLWKKVIQTVIPLNNGKHLKNADNSTEKSPSSQPQTPRSPYMIPPNTIIRSSNNSSLLRLGDVRQMDRASAARLKKGKMPVEATLDLHGYTQQQAAEQIDHFIAKAAATHKRCLLVITGKGKIGEGILRQALPQWLNLPHNQEKILAFTHASSKDGGEGAFYILLKKHRK